MISRRKRAEVAEFGWMEGTLQARHFAGEEEAQVVVVAEEVEEEEENDDGEPECPQWLPRIGF